MYILAGYGVRSRSLHLLMTYWEHMTMVAKVGIYNPPPLKVSGV